ncbi:MAG: mannose-1-phosphate guanylyltransferase [Erythrobacter sp.]
MIDGPRIHPVILCGGSGTRLWPVSRKARPKPFLPLVETSTLFEQAVGRVRGHDRFAAPLVVAGAAHIDLVTEQMYGAEHRLIVEPCAKNTAPAIALAASLLPPDDIMLVCPSDHHIADEGAFREAALAAATLAAEDYLVSFGITPDRPETGYGYIRRGVALEGGFTIEQFVEKPDLERAREYLASGEYSWNGGIFAFRAGAMLDELAAHRPAMAEAVREAVAKGCEEGSRFHPCAEIFGAIEADSIDYAVMENTERAAMVPADMGWSDIGNWAALRELLATDPSKVDLDGNITRGEVDLNGCNDVMAFTDGPRVSVVGVDDVCIIVSEGEIMVTSYGQAQYVGQLPGAKDQ